jgi:hypothetical protein
VDYFCQTKVVSLLIVSAPHVLWPTVKIDPQPSRFEPHINRRLAVNYAIKSRPVTASAQRGQSIGRVHHIGPFGVSTALDYISVARSGAVAVAVPPSPSRRVLAGTQRARLVKPVV